MGFEEINPRLTRSLPLAGLRRSRLCRSFPGSLHSSTSLGMTWDAGPAGTLHC